MVGMARAGNRAGDVSVCRTEIQAHRRGQNTPAFTARSDDAAPALGGRNIYRLKNDDSVDPVEAEAASGFAGAGAGCAAGAGAGSSRFERFEE